MCETSGIKQMNRNHDVLAGYEFDRVEAEKSPCDLIASLLD